MHGIFVCIVMVLLFPVRKKSYRPFFAGVALGCMMIIMDYLTTHIEVSVEIGAPLLAFSLFLVGFTYCKLATSDIDASQIIDVSVGAGMVPLYYPIYGLFSFGIMDSGFSLSQIMDFGRDSFFSVLSIFVYATPVALTMMGVIFHKKWLLFSAMFFGFLWYYIPTKLTTQPQLENGIWKMLAQLEDSIAISNFFKIVFAFIGIVMVVKLLKTFFPQSENTW